MCPEGKPKPNLPENRPNASVPETKLDAILSATRDRVASLRSRARELERRARATPDPRPFAPALAGREVGVIAEVKRRSPSAGAIREDLDPVAHAQAYVRGGRDQRLGVLVEVHSVSELELALSVDPTAVGVNSRDLATFAVDLGRAEQLVALVPGGVPVIAESGIATRADVERMAAAGADLVLVGTSVAGNADPGAAVARLVGVPRKGRP